MNGAIVTGFPPTALYATLALTVAVLSLVATFHREAVVANKLLNEWGSLLGASAYLSLGSWGHVAGYLLWEFFDPAYSFEDKIHQLAHLTVLFVFGIIFYHIWCFWDETQTGVQNVMPHV